MEDQIDFARRIAYIMGASSGAAQAVARYDQLIAGGHETSVALVGRAWLVREPKPLVPGEMTDA